MKISWGTGIVIAFALFISFIMYFVVNMIVDKKYDHDFVTQDYYKKEVEYQGKIDRTQKTEQEKMDVQITASDEGITLLFPEKTNTEIIDGTVSFYRPSDKKRDFKIPLQIKNGTMLVPINVLAKGRWNVEVEYDFNKNNYLTIRNINIK
ncbi:FixH family protein [Capnocytophaga sp.]|uniref:FixH family protein n=1 Tax=Capnocytophaga sp. TaxID=44737 RepID=UPI0026DBABE1|nr:FixH family protein [Capnocytophaga sp.]MDO5104818.1 FixH family protein [Capnocytophaga sp.]